MPEKSYIELIRSQYSGMEDMPRESLASSVKTLADDLYSKDSHFIFELIQNAEDNAYAPGIAPKLSFELREMDVEGIQRYFLTINNNETGFNRSNVRALCQVGRSTKKKAQGYIGEKGIGFKSVFRITTCPYVFSKGFHFCLPEEDEGTGLGYIVPRWVSSVPTRGAKDATSIMLPLDKDGASAEAVLGLLRDISPETILFLEKLVSLEIFVSIPESEQQYSCIIEKKVTKTIGASKLVALTCKKRIDAEEEVVETCTYWLTEIEYEKPESACHEKRADIASRGVSVAIPLEGSKCKGKLFAYLPVWEDTGLPFLINADFLLVSSREGVKEGEEWNRWLRACTGETYFASLLALLKAPEIPLEAKAQAYASIPLKSNQGFLEPLVAAIHQQLAGSACILAVPDHSLIFPPKSRLCSQNFRALLLEIATFPAHLSEDVHLVIPEIEPFFECLRAIGVKSLSLADVMAVLQDNGWLEAHPVSWFVDLFRYLRLQPKLNLDELRKSHLIPVHSVNRELRLSCHGEQPIYLALTVDQQGVFEQAPQWLQKQVPIAVLDPMFLDQISQQSDANELKKWMQEALNIHDFSVPLYCNNVVAKLSELYLELGCDEILEVTVWLEQNAPANFDWSNLPVVVSGERKMLLKAARNLNLVVPETYNKKSGWQHLWVHPQDRSHFVALADCYQSLPQKWFDSIKAHQYPGFKKQKTSTWEVPADFLEETKLAEICREKAAMSRRSDTRITFAIPPASLVAAKGGAGNALSDAVGAYLQTLAIPETCESWWQKDILHDLGLYALGTYENHGPDSLREPSTLLRYLRTIPWLPTTNGPLPPCQTFINKESIREVLGDTVPYYIGALPENALKLLQVHREVTVNELLALLRDLAGRLAGELKLLQRVYPEIHNRTELNAHNIRKIFSEEALIYLPVPIRGRNWFKSSECVWSDAASALGEDFAYLEKSYPKLEAFFTKRLNVKKRADEECFAERWLMVQENPPGDQKARRDLLGNLFAEIKRVAFLAGDERPAWWKEFSTVKAKLYTQSGRFVDPTDLVISDDGVLHDIFKGDVDLEFAWRPEFASLDDYVRFYRAFNVPLLSESVNEKLEESGDLRTLETNSLVTESAIKMVAAWLREKRSSDYERLLEENVFEQLFTLREAHTSANIRVEFQIETEHWLYDAKTVRYPAFWDRNNNILMCQPGTERIVIAETIAKKLISGHKDLAAWIELILESATTERLKHRSWNVPQEIIECFKICKARVTSGVEADVSGDEPSEGGCSEDSVELKDTSGDSDVAVVSYEALVADHAATTSKPHVSTAGPTASGDQMTLATPPAHGSEEVKETPAKEGATIDYGKAIGAAFNQPGCTDFNEEHQTRVRTADDGVLPNPARRAEKLQEEYSRSLQAEPSPGARRKEVERALLEGRNEAVRASLYDWYHGKCQICGDTWPKRDGTPYFVAACLDERQHARWLDDPGNAICLCATHFAQWRLAAKKEERNIKSQILGLRLDGEGGNGDLSIHFKMLEKDCYIKYSERHLLALRKLIDVADLEHGKKATAAPEEIAPAAFVSAKAPDEVFIDRSGHQVVVCRTAAPTNQKAAAPAISKECPYCKAKVKEQNFITHVQERCPNRPKSTAPSAVTSVKIKAEPTRSGRIRCRFCSNLPMPGSDVCYSCSC